MANLVVLIVGWVVGVGLSMVVLYYVIRAAILSALREHTMNSTTAVSVTSAVPLRLAGEENGEGRSSSPNNV